MFGSYKVKIDDELLGKLKQCAEAGGYESVDFASALREKCSPSCGVPRSAEVSLRVIKIEYLCVSTG